MGKFIMNREYRNKLIDSNLFFLTEINRKLKSKLFSREKDKSCIVLVHSDKIPYYWESVKAIQKHYSDENWEMKLTHFYKTEKSGINCYTWEFKRKH